MGKWTVSLAPALDVGKKIIRPKRQNCKLICVVGVFYEYSIPRSCALISMCKHSYMTNSFCDKAGRKYVSRKIHIDGNCFSKSLSYCNEHNMFYTNRQILTELNYFQ